VAVDISTDYLADALDYLQFRHPKLDILGIGMDFSAEFSLPGEISRESPVVFYPGSSIGNFTPSAAEAFLRQVRSLTTGGGLLIGVDLVKPLAILEPAYDDALGVTAAFNRNMLTVVNHLLEADFKVADFRHVAFFNAKESRIEMHLEAVRDVTVCWPGATRRFNQGERIHTENSYKYEIGDFAALLDRAGYGQTHHWTDGRGWFALFWAEA
jgi:dimethylhistidine N-methyltransferase